MAADTHEYPLACFEGRLFLHRRKKRGQPDRRLKAAKLQGRSFRNKIESNGNDGVNSQQLCSLEPMRLTVRGNHGHHQDGKKYPAISKPLKSSVMGWPSAKDKNTSTGATKSAICVLAPVAIVIARSM